MAIATIERLPQGHLAAGVAELHAALDRLHTTHPGPAGAHEVTAALVREIDRAGRRVEALRLKVIAAAERAELAQDAGLTGTDAWVARHTQTTRPQAARDLRLADQLDSDDFVRTASALDNGALSADHAAVITEATRQLPRGVSSEQRATVEASLITKAARYDPGQLRRIARRELALIEPDQVVVDDHEDALVSAEEDAAYERASLTLHHNADGTVSGHFTVPTHAGAILTKLIDSLTAPRRTDRVLAETLNWPQRRGQAFVELLEHLPADRLHTKAAATVIVTIDHGVLTGALKAAGLDTGESLSAGQARRLACQAGLLPAVLGGSSQILDLGRQQRLFSDTQRTALAASHRTCAAAGCDRPYAWCELHHQTPWSHGGDTDLTNALPLCGHHHRLIHHRDYRHRRTADGLEFRRARC